MTDANRSELILSFPASRLTAARQALTTAHTRLVRAAAKAGQDAPAAPTLAVANEYWYSTCCECKTGLSGVAGGSCMIAGCDGVLVCRKVVDLTLRFAAPRLAGWEFLAVIEPLSGGNLIRRVPGAATVDGELDRWRTCAINCDHCDARRRRIETFLVRADGSDPAIPRGAYRQVGRNCLESFLGGRSALAILAAIGWPALVRDAGGEDEGEGGSGGGSGAEASHAPVEFLSWVAALVRIAGWVSRAQANETGVQATAQRALALITPPFLGRDAWRKERERFNPSEDDRTRAAAALEWARQLAGSGDYEANLLLVATQPAMANKHAGILASAVSAHARAIGDRLAREARATAPSAHVGTVGEKSRDFGRVTCERVASYPTQFGVTHVHTFRDVAGNALVWKTSKSCAAAGDVVEEMSGTIKAHSEYRGEAQTELTRCVLISAEDIARRQAIVATTKVAKAKQVRRPKATKRDAVTAAEPEAQDRVTE